MRYKRFYSLKQCIKSLDKSALCETYISENTKCPYIELYLEALFGIIWFKDTENVHYACLLMAQGKKYIAIWEYFHLALELTTVLGPEISSSARPLSTEYPYFMPNYKSPSGLFSLNHFNFSLVKLPLALCTCCLAKSSPGLQQNFLSSTDSISLTLSAFQVT